MLLYHFTTDRHLEGILSERVLRTTDPNLLPNNWIDHRVVWFLDTPTADDADHGLGDGHSVIGEIDGAPVVSADKRALRVTVDVPDAHPWLEWLKERPHDPTWVEAIVRIGGGTAAAQHWYVVERPIPAVEWTEVRNMRTGEVYQ